MSTLHIYRSSAGSGKTHTLVSTYLQLALASPMRFQEILAVTFTNQATKEMKQRILTYLHALTQGINHPIAAELLTILDWDQTTLQKQAKKLLSNILHHYDRFMVTTIDSFFQTIIRSFAKELGIPPNFHIQLDQTAVLEQLIEELLSDASQEPALEEWLITFAEHKLIHGKSWHFKDELMMLGKEIFQEAFILQETALMQAIQDKNILYNFLTTLQQIITHFETSLQALGQHALQAIHTAGLAIPDFAYGVRGVAGYLLSLQEKRSFAPTQRARNALENISAWYTARSANKHTIIQVVETTLQPLLRQVINFYEAHYQPYHTALAIQHFVYGLGILTHLKGKLQDYRVQKNRMLISDTTHLLRQVITDNETPFIYEKIGTYYKHFLIDEFQDISGFQWQNIKPLINNGLAEGYPSFLVGDVKQSIYRWRGGNWRLLSKQLTDELPRTTTATLNQNWRSKRNIVDFNNTFFKDASLALAEHLRTDIQALTDPPLKHKLTEQVQEIVTAYQDVYQHIPESCLQGDAGYVQVTLLKEAEDTTGIQLSWKEQVKQRLPSLIESLQDDGYSLGDIALLVRNNAEGRELFQTLLAYQQSSQAKPGYQYQAISAESLYLGHNPWINILMNALKYLIHPADELIKAELIYLYQYYVCHNPVSWHAADQDLAAHHRGLLPQRFWDEQDQLQDLPLYERIIALIPIFQLQRTETAPFIQTFLDAVWAYLDKEPAEIYQFLDWWEYQGKILSLPHMPGQNAITIMTIHQAKGLQFKVVILPFCDWNFDHSAQRPPIIWCESSTDPFAQFPILPLRYHKNLKDTLYVRNYYEERMQTYLDNLNLLYVAFTRPEDRLYIFGKQPNKPNLKTMSELLLHTFTQLASFVQTHESTPKKQITWHQYWDDQTQTLVLGDPQPIIATTPITDNPYTPSFLLNPWRTQLHVKKVDEPMQATSIQAIQLEWMADILTKLQTEKQLPNMLAHLKIEQGLTPMEVEEIEKYTNNLWKNPIIKAWYDGSWIVQQPTTLLAPAGKVYAPNRIMIQSNQALVIAFVTDTDTHAHEQAYQQMQETTNLLKTMAYTAVKSYLLDLCNQTLYSYHESSVTHLN